MEHWPAPFKRRAALWWPTTGILTRKGTGAWTWPQNLLRAGGRHLAPWPPGTDQAVALVCLSKLQLNSRSGFWTPTLWPAGVSVTWHFYSGSPCRCSCLLSPGIGGGWEHHGGCTWRVHHPLKDTQLSTDVIHASAKVKHKHMWNGGSGSRGDPSILGETGKTSCRQCHLVWSQNTPNFPEE